MHTIFQTLVYQREKGHDAVLATIIWDDGSAPRGKGSQMLVGRDGLLAGTIGGGAVEGQAIALAQEMLHSGADSHTHEFRLRRDGSAQSTGMVCGGDVTVYFRRVPAADGAWDTLAAHGSRAGWCSRWTARCPICWTTIPARKTALQCRCPSASGH